MKIKITNEEIDINTNGFGKFDWETNNQTLK